MSQSSETDRVRAGTGHDLKAFSCLRCRQRKVKCNRRNLCSNCVKASIECSFVAPVRGQPKRRKVIKEGLHAKLRRYEDMLRSYGAKIEPFDNDQHNSDVETVSELDVEMAEDTDPRNKSHAHPFVFDETKIRLITKNGSSRYFDIDRWPSLGDEFHNPDEVTESLVGLNIQTSNPLVDSSEDSGLVLSTASTSENLASLHYPFHTVQKMFDIYIDRVDPLMKVLHLPTFWPTLKSALQNSLDMPKSLEAVTFAFYLSVIISLEDDECHSLLGEQKAIVSARYKIAARQALIKAGFLRTSSLMTLQAYVIFLMGMRGHYQGDSLFVLSGIAVRLGRRMGLHRDGTLLGLSPFETELRSRLWWHIVHIDCYTSEFAGTKPSMDLFLSDTRMPLNVEDEDLSPDMLSPPPERTGITSVVLCLIRYDVLNFLRKVTPQFSYEIRWDNLSSASITLAEKDKMINQMEDIFERKYLRYYEPIKSLHTFSSIVARSSICKMKRFAHNPRQFANFGVKVPQTSQDIIFENGTRMLEYVGLMHSNETLRKFTWQMGTGYLWDPLLYVLIETRHRKVGPEVDRVWKLIGGVFLNYPHILTEASGALYAAIGNWTLQVWDECAAERKVQGLPDSPTPEYISAIRRSRKMPAVSSSKPNGSTDHGGATGNSTTYGEAQPLIYTGNSITDLEPADSYDFSNLLSFDLEPSDWAQWERLLAGQGI